MTAPLRVLVVEDSEDDAVLVLRVLEKAGFRPESQRVETEGEFLDALRHKWDIILADFNLPSFGALQALRVLQEKNLDIPFIAVSGTATDTAMLEVLKAGAGDYLMKDHLARLGAAVERELREAASRRERRQLEEQFRHAQKMEAVGRLAGGVAHDFNNLLTVITGYSDLLLAAGGLDEMQQMGLEEIRRAAERGGGLTHQLLAFSRRQPLAPKIIRPDELLVGMEKMLRRLIGEDIELVVAPEATGAAVQTDQGQLEQVLMNLAVNARDAMPDGGKLTLESTRVGLDARTSAVLEVDPGPFVLITITDTGSGMDEETRSHIFEPFFTTKAPGKGTGLGMATAYGIMRQSGGAIAVESEPGHGTTIRLYLPEADASEPADGAETSAVSSLEGHETILLVEDEPRVRKLIQHILTGYGYRVLDAIRGEEALRICESKANRVALAIVDVIMPEMSGPELVKRLMRIRPNIRVLYISGYTDEAIVHHNILASGAAFLQKPFLPVALVRKVREVLGNQSRTATEE